MFSLLLFIVQLFSYQHDLSVLAQPCILYWQTQQTFAEALAPGTRRNRRRQAELYIKYMLSYNLDYLQPSVADLAMYLQFLANSYPTPATVRNSFSGAKSWVSSFLSPELATLAKTITEKSSHCPSQAWPITPDDIHVICSYLDVNNCYYPVAFKPCILLAFTSFLRASNVLSPSFKEWGGPHTLKVRDIVELPDRLLLIIRSTKTFRGRKPITLTIMPSRHSTICPVASWKAYRQLVNPCPLGPAFITRQGLPITPGPVVDAMRKALAAANHPNPSAITFHSLRRGGAQAAAALGASKEQIMIHGTWKSQSGLAAYVKPSPHIVPSLMALTLA